MEITRFPLASAPPRSDTPWRYQRRRRSPQPCQTFDLRRFSQRPDHIENVIASVQRIEQMVVFPIDCTTMLIVPCSGSELSMVIGMRSPCS